jgi:hypothetical protein
MSYHCLHVEALNERHMDCDIQILARTASEGYAPILSKARLRCVLDPGLLVVCHREIDNPGLTVLVFIAIPDLDLVPIRLRAIWEVLFAK